MLALAPLEILLILIAAYGLFRLFCRLLNSRKLSKVINEVTHPTPDSDDEIVASVERSLDVAEQRAAENDALIAQKQRRNEAIRKYGGVRRP